LLEYSIVGLALGAVYAIAASGLIITYVSSGILNFAFGPMAYFLARFYYFLLVQHGWPIVPAAIVTIGLAGPLMGALLYLALFRHLRNSTTLIKIVATIGLAVALPSIAKLIFGSIAIPTAPGLAPEPVHVFRFGGAGVNLNQVIAFAALIIVVVVGGLVLRFTSIGLRVRAMVDSATLTSLCGVSPSRVAVGVWAASTTLAALAGVLLAPTIGLSNDQYVLLMDAALAAVIAARLKNLPIGIVAGLAIGWLSSIVQKFLPPDSSFTAAIVPSIPFGIILLFLLYYLFIGGGVDEDRMGGGALDRAVMTVDTGPVRTAGATARRRLDPRISLGPAGLVIVVALLPLVLTSYWTGLIGSGLAMSVVFLSFTVVTGQGGMIWLCQATLAGVGAVTTAQLATVYHMPIIPAILISALLAGVIGLLIGVLTIQMGTLYVALVTLSFGLLIETLVFSIQRFDQYGAGVILARPSFATSDDDFIYFGLVVFCIVAFLVMNVRRATTGLSLAAVRSSERGARSIGLSVLSAKLIAAGVGSFVAGLGGGMMAIYAGAATPATYATLTGIVWLAVVASIGIRTNVAALIAGLVFAVIPGAFAAYLPSSWGEVPAALFGLGAIVSARNPEGVVALHGRQIHDLIQRVSASRASRASSPSPALAGGPDDSYAAAGAGHAAASRSTGRKDEARR
jgi:branched-chain amino acid transport system permease protein